MEGVQTLIIDALRFKPLHHSHMTVDEAIALARRVKAQKTYFVHMNHDMGLHKDVNKILPRNFMLAYDGLQIEV